ncbi:S-methyl-5-thioribose-1-phosphate isomerase [Gordonibacter sp. An232A]|nr:S-methyl-5-thioribose-1-phosphate isomerase [Gordonibacter sp. An232A]
MTRLRLENLPRTIELVRADDGAAELVYVDQRLLPGELAFARTRDWRAVVGAVRSLAVRGAPAIGAAGAAAVALWAQERADPRACSDADASPYLAELDRVCAQVASVRPTAVNLSWGVERMRRAARGRVLSGSSVEEVAAALFDAVKALEADDEAANRAIGAHGAALLPKDARILTHCNAGSLATVFFGTALGIVYAAAAQGKVARVYADETRPVGQGARLTCWELAQTGIPVTLICDNMAASLMAKGEVDAVVVGADRIAANGDVANKIGTYGLAVLARRHGVPFYVAAPASTVDKELSEGSQIPIEERAPAEVLPRPIAGVEVWNPAFDVTPAALIARIVTEDGAFAPDDLP